MKSFEDINILIEVKLICLKNLLLEKNVLKNKNNVIEKILKNFFWKKNKLLFKTNLKKNFFLQKKISENFFNLWHLKLPAQLKVQVPNSPDI